MLRRKFLVIFGSLVVLLGLVAGIAIWMFQGVLDGLDHLNTEATAVVDHASNLNTTLTAVKLDLYRLQLGRNRHLDQLIDDVEKARSLIAELEDRYVVHEPGAKQSFQDLTRTFPEFERHVSSLATAQDPTLARHYNAEALAVAMRLREAVQKIDDYAREHARREQAELAGRFRWLVLGLALGSLLVINISILFLMKAAAMVIRPVDQLVEAGRELSRERFDHRAHLEEAGEFSEIAEAYNRLAEKLQANEQRRMEMLGQVAATLNHELNNAISIIELQLEVVGRQARGDDRFEECLRHMHEGLQRMARTVQSLGNIRRIVLTDYISGVKMLDLERSVGEQPALTEAARGADSESGEHDR